MQIAFIYIVITGIGWSLVLGLDFPTWKLCVVGFMHAFIALTGNKVMRFLDALAVPNAEVTGAPTTGANKGDEA